MMITFFSSHPTLSCFVGALLMLVLAVACSQNRARIPRRMVATLLGLQGVMLFFLLKTSFGQSILAGMVYTTTVINTAAQQGIKFVFGALGAAQEPWGFVFAFHVLPIIIFFSALIAALAYLGVIDLIINVLSVAIRPLVGTSKPETAAAIAKSFSGTTEQQLLIREYLPTMTDPELFAVMVTGLSTVSASLFALYIQLGAPAQHIIAANLIGVIGALLFAKIVVPPAVTIPTAAAKEAAESRTMAPIIPHKPKNLIEALIHGTIDGMHLASVVGALLIAFLSLIALLNYLFVTVGSYVGSNGMTFQACVGYLCAPLGLLMGVPSAEAFQISELIGLRLLANEVVAFSALSEMLLSARGLVLATYALCSFANISTIGIVVGGLGTLIPARRSVLSAMGFKALFAATLANLFSAYLVGMVL